MPSSPRRDLIRDGEIATYHVWSRTAQQRFLMGFDEDTKKNHEHRRAWLVRLLAHQARHFAVDVANFQPMGNHFHLIVRTRPDIVRRWSDEEVAWHWRMAWPKFHDERKDWYRNPTDADIRKLLGKPEKLAQVRKNLSSLSWFVARVKEPFAKLCNSLAETEGHFWAERFGSRELVDDAAILACSMYVDVNQIKADMATSLSKSTYSAIQARIIEGRMREAEEAMETLDEWQGEKMGLSLSQLQEMYMSCSWIAPIRPDGALKLVNDAWQAYVAPDQPAMELPALDRMDSSSEAGADISGLSESEQLPADPDADQVDQPMRTSAEVRPTEGDDLPCGGCRCSDSDAGLPHNIPTALTESLATASLGEEIVGPSMKDSAPTPSDSMQTTDARSDSHSPAGTLTLESSEEKARAPTNRPRNQPTYEIHRRLLSQTPLRASDNPFLDMTLEQYLRLAEAAAERVLNSRDSPISESLANILCSHGIASEAWHETLDAFDKLFCHVAGAPRHVEAFAERTGRKGVHGMDACRRVFIDVVESVG
jgi:REP element-mobilizing transposase RayT